MSDFIDISMLTEEQHQALVCMYFSRLPKTDLRYKKRMEYWEILSKRFGPKPLTYRNYKDSYDQYFDGNGRVGYNTEPIEKKYPNHPELKQVLDMFFNTETDILEVATEEIIRLYKQEQYSFISMKVGFPDTVHKILAGEKEIVVDGIYTLKDELKLGRIVFVVLGGDTGKASVDWKPGFYAIAHIVREPYDIGYERTAKNDYFKIDIQIDCTFDYTVKRADFIDYKDAYDATYIGPELKRDPTQAISSLEDTKAVAVIRAILDKMPNLKEKFVEIFPEDFMKRVLGAVCMLVPTQVAYGETVDDAINDYTQIKEILEEDSELEKYLPYTKEKFLSEVFMEEEDYELLSKLLMTKQNVILQGSPGVGKTFMAKRLAYSIMGCIDSKRVQMVQFHQSYSYEDFIVGYRPTGTGFELTYGPFYEFCKMAEKDSRPYFFIIDEINRGNVSKIFGELLMLIENDKRGEKLKLLYTKEEFSVPKNVYIIGMMNTADRSLAIIDYALRRRFAFYDVRPAFYNKTFMQMVENKKSKNLSRLISYVKELNDDISSDDSLGRGFEVGHSYFCTSPDTQIDHKWIKSTVEYELIPLINEYWFDDSDKVDEWSKKLRGVEND